MQEDKLIEIYDISYTPFWETPLFFYASFISIILIFLIILFFLIRYYYKRLPIYSPNQKAMYELKILKKNLISSHDIAPDQFYAQLLQIIKRYLQDKLQISSLASTEFQLAQSLSRYPGFSDEDLCFFYSLLERAQLIKFAKMTTIASNMLSDIDRCVKLITDLDAYLKKDSSL